MNSTTHLQAGTCHFRRSLLTLSMVLCLALGTLAPHTARAVAPSSGVLFSDALANAHKIAELDPTWELFMVKGQSMEPQFGANSILVAAQTKYSDLKVGMLVVYKDSTGDLVAHRIIQKNDNGWVAKGYNNDKTDPCLVTAQNLQGVVFGILNYKHGSDALATVDLKGNPPVAFAKTY
ncbi:MAG TPA: signal peptidase I [Opitutales bacterium]|nr:signal peptidase I [Opitutales bacterium]